MFRAAFVVVLTWGLVARAEPDPTAKKHAAELAAESAQHYKRGEFEVSVALLRQAYALYPEPNLLYNLGRSLESLGDVKGAVEAYESYLATAKAIEDRGAIERRVATLKADLAEKERLAKPAEVPAPPPAPVVVQPLPAPAQPADTTEHVSALPWIPIVAGLAVVGGGAYFGHASSTKHDQAVVASVGTDAQQLQSDATNDAKYANVLFVAGGVVLAGGVIWEIVARATSHHASNAVGARIHVSPTTVGLEWTLP